MIRTFLSAALVMALTGLILAQNPNTPNANQNPNVNKANKGQQATITKVDAKNGTVIVKMKDKNGKEAEKTFKLEGNILYLDSTGKEVAIDFFRSGDDVLVVEAEGHLKGMQKANAAAPGQQDPRAAQLDKDFAFAADEINMAEMKLGKLAQDRGTMPAVKQLGERLLNDHTKMNADLQKVAQKEGITLPGKIDEKHRDLYESLAKVNGATFDMNFARDMLKGHEHAIHTFEMQAKNGQDAALKSYAERWVPTLREHLQIARGIVSQGK